MLRQPFVLSLVRLHKWKVEIVYGNDFVYLDEKEFCLICVK